MDRCVVPKRGCQTLRSFEMLKMKKKKNLRKEQKTGNPIEVFKLHALRTETNRDDRTASMRISNRA